MSDSKPPSPKQHGLSKKMERHHKASRAGAVSIKAGTTQPVQADHDQLGLHQVCRVARDQAEEISQPGTASVMGSSTVSQGARTSIINHEKLGLHVYRNARMNANIPDENLISRLVTGPTHQVDPKLGLRRTSNSQAGVAHSSMRGLAKHYDSSMRHSHGNGEIPAQAEPGAEHANDSSLPTLRGLTKNRNFDFSVPGSIVPTRDVELGITTLVPEETANDILEEHMQREASYVVQGTDNSGLPQQEPESLEQAPTESRRDEQEQTELLQETHADDDLAVAYPVVEQEQTAADQMPTAEQFDLQKRTDDLAFERRKSLRLLALTGLVILLLVVTVVVVVTKKHSSDTSVIIIVAPGDPNNTTNTNQTTIAPTPQSSEDYVFSLLPNFTIHSINQPGSPQFLAYKWLLEDPRLLNYTEARILRRFALASLYYSTGGAEWRQYGDNWMDINAHELTWETSFHHKNEWMEAVVNMTEADMDNFTDSVGFLYLSLSHNNMKGTIPPELFIGLPDLQYINFGNNELTGTLPAEIVSLSSLEYLALPKNILTGPLPTLGRLDKLTFASFDFNSFTGTFPSVPPSIMSLFANNNLISGQIPTEIGLAENLTLLYLEENWLTSAIPSEIGNTDLNEFRIHDNFITGSLPSEIGRLDSLGYFDARNNSISGPLPSELGVLSSLWYLSFSHNARITGQIPSEIGLLRQLVHIFFVGNTNLNTTIPSELGLLPSLESIWLDEANILGQIPSELGQLETLQYLSLWGARLSSTIPTELGKLEDLYWFLVQENALTGPIPSELGNLKSAEAILLRNNLLSSTIPTELGSLQTALGMLAIRSNQLTGSLPSELGLCGALSDFTASNNRLSGQLPSELGNLRSLENLNLADNKLWGDIPLEIAGMVDAGSLQSLNISNNVFHGTVPFGLCILEEGLDFTCSDTLCGCSCACNE